MPGSDATPYDLHFGFSQDRSTYLRRCAFTVGHIQAVDGSLDRTGQPLNLGLDGDCCIGEIPLRRIAQNHTLCKCSQERCSWLHKKILRHLLPGLRNPTFPVTARQTSTEPGPLRYLSLRSKGRGLIATAKPNESHTSCQSHKQIHPGCSALRNGNTHLLRVPSIAGRHEDEQICHRVEKLLSC